MGGYSDEKTRAFPNLKLEELISPGSGICSIFWDCSKLVDTPSFIGVAGTRSLCLEGKVIGLKPPQGAQPQAAGAPLWAVGGFRS